MKEYQKYDDKSLLKLIAKNDEPAFAELYDRFWNKIFAIAYNRLQEVETAEDIVHDVFASLWANRHKIEIDKLENYLATAAKYLILAKLKKKERMRIYSATLQSPVIELALENTLHYKRILEMVINEVENLPEKCKLIFKSSRNDGKSVKQIAQELHLSPKTVENQLNKALKQLKVVVRPFLSLF